MSKIKELRKNNSVSIMDVIDLICPVEKTKYKELIIRLLKNKIENSFQRNELIGHVTKEYGISKNKFDDYSDFELIQIIRTLEMNFSSSHIQDIVKFCDYNERGLIVKNDILKYNSFEEISCQVGLADMNINKKILEKEVCKIFEDDQWLLIRPLTLESSLKYGAGTTWCTSSRENPTHYYKYSIGGILIYCINKTNGVKVAFYNEISEYEPEFSFWNQTDKKIDSLQSGLPFNILDKIKEEITTRYISNSLLRDKLKIRDENIEKYVVLEKFRDEISPIHRIENIGEGIMVETRNEDGLMDPPLRNGFNDEIPQSEFISPGVNLTERDETTFITQHMEYHINDVMGDSEPSINETMVNPMVMIPEYKTSFFYDHPQNGEEM